MTRVHYWRINIATTSNRKKLCFCFIKINMLLLNMTLSHFLCPGWEIHLPLSWPYLIESLLLVWVLFLSQMFPNSEFVSPIFSREVLSAFLPLIHYLTFCHSPKSNLPTLLYISFHVDDVGYIMALLWHGCFLLTSTHYPRSWPGDSPPIP